MAPMNLLEKMDKLVTTMNTTSLIMMLCIIVFISVMFIFSEKNKKYSYISYILILVFVGFTFKDSLFRLTDMFIERLFYLFYFPTGAIYMITLVISHVIFLHSLGNRSMEKSTKNINFVGFSLMQILCINVLNYLSTSNIDLTNELNFAGDKTMLGILELSMMVFTLWMGILLVKTVIHKLTRVVLSHELSEIPVMGETLVSADVPTDESHVNSSPTLKPLFASVTTNISEKWNQVKEYKPIIQEEVPTMNDEQPKMNQELLDRLLRPETMLNNTLQVAETKTTTESQPVVAWSDAVVDALHIPSEPIYNDIEDAYMNRIVETVPEVEKLEEVKEINDIQTTKQDTSKAFDLCQLLLRKQEDTGHSLDDYLELRKYLVAQK